MLPKNGVAILQGKSLKDVFDKPLSNSLAKHTKLLIMLRSLAAVGLLSTQYSKHLSSNSFISGGAAFGVFGTHPFPSLKMYSSSLQNILSKL